MSNVFCIGEALIDFIPVQKNTSLREVTGFERMAGGAPMNVAIAVSKYGAHSVMLTIYLMYLYPTALILLIFTVQPKEKQVLHLYPLIKMEKEVFPSIDKMQQIYCFLLRK